MNLSELNKKLETYTYFMALGVALAFLSFCGLFMAAGLFFLIKQIGEKILGL